MDLVATVTAVAVLTQGLVTHAGLLRAGASRVGVSRAVAAGDLVRVRRRVYALAALDPLPRYLVTEAGPAPAYVRHVRAALLSLGPAAAARGRTAAVLYGWGLLVEPSRTLEVSVPHGYGAVVAPGLDVRQRRRRQVRRHVAVPGTFPVRTSSPVQTVLDCVLDLPLLQAVVLCDSALRSGRVGVGELRAATRDLSGVRDARRVRRVLELCDPEAGSVLESVLRVRLVLAGVTGFRSQLLVRSSPALRVDLAFPELGLVVEADGAKWHPDPARDQQRDNALAALGWRVLRYTWSDVVHDHARVVAEVRAALACGTPTLQVAPAGRAQAA